MRAVVLGGTTLDVFAPGIEELPRRPAAEFTTSSLVTIPDPPTFTIGGNGANVAFALARLGASVELHTGGLVGVAGSLVRGWLEEAGCEVDPLCVTPASVNLVAVDREGTRYSFFHPVPIPTDAALERERTLELAAGDHLLLRGFPHPEEAVLRTWASAGRERGAVISLDIGPQLAGFTLERLQPLLADLDLVIGNREEIEALDTAGERQVVRRLTASGTAVIVKRGRVGVSWFDAEQGLSVAAFDADAAVTVGAGDAFDAGLLYALSVGEPPRHALRFGAAVAAIVLRRGMGTLGAPVEAEAAAFLDEHTDRSSEEETT